MYDPIAHMNEYRRLYAGGTVPRPRKQPCRLKRREQAEADAAHAAAPVTRNYIMTLAVAYHQRRQARIAEDAHLATLGDFEIPF